MKVILSIDGIKPLLTGIGKYAWELANRIPTLPGIELVRFFAGGNWVGDAQVEIYREVNGEMSRSS